MGIKLIKGEEMENFKKVLEKELRILKEERNALIAIDETFCLFKSMRSGAVVLDGFEEEIAEKMTDIDVRIESIMNIFDAIDSYSGKQKTTSAPTVKQASDFRQGTIDILLGVGLEKATKGELL